MLDAGATITVAGPNGAQGLSYSSPSTGTSPYFGLLGASGSIASAGLTSSPLFLNPGTCTVSGSGGKGCGAVLLPHDRRNRSNVDEPRSNLGYRPHTGPDHPLKRRRLDQTSGDDPRLASNPAISASGSFACLVTFDQGSFTVPPSMMANLPSTAGTNPGDVQSGLMFLTFPAGTQFINFNTSAALSLTNGMALFVTGDLRSNVTYK